MLHIICACAHDRRIAACAAFRILRVNVSALAKAIISDNNAASKMVIMFSRMPYVHRSYIGSGCMRIPSKYRAQCIFSWCIRIWNYTAWRGVVLENWFSLFFSSILSKCRCCNGHFVLANCVRHITLLARMIVTGMHFFE